MKHSNDLLVHFYQQLGRLFYTLAAADKHVRVEEVAVFKKIFKEEWESLLIHIFKEEKGAIKKIETVFDFLAANEVAIDKTLTEFKKFKEMHPQLFDLEVKELILKTAEAITNVSSGKNKSELVIMSKLHSILVN